MLLVAATIVALLSSLFLNVMLLYLISKHTTPALKSYSLIIKIHAYNDLFGQLITFASSTVSCYAHYTGCRRAHIFVSSLHLH